MVEPTWYFGISSPDAVPCTPHPPDEAVLSEVGPSVARAVAASDVDMVDDVAISQALGDILGMAAALRALRRRNVNGFVPDQDVLAALDVLLERLI